MTSSSFNRQTSPNEVADDRRSTAVQSGDGPQQFPPSPSFQENDRPAVRLVELPAWLQSFASSVGEPPELETTPPPSTSTEYVVNSANDQKPTPAPSTSAKPASSTTDFISEDDLPEWLRAIAPDDGPDTDVELTMPRDAGSGEPVAVPTISRAWSTSKDARGVDEATSLFALVASQTPQPAMPSTDAAPTTGRVATVSSDDSERTQVGSDTPPRSIYTDPNTTARDGGHGEFVSSDFPSDSADCRRWPSVAHPPRCRRRVVRALEIGLALAG